MAKIEISDKEKKIIVKVVVVFAIAYGLVWGGNRTVTDFQQTERSTNETLKSEEADYRTRLAQIQDEERLQNQYIESYLDYQSSGLIVGSEYAPDSEITLEQDEARRLELLERLQRIQFDRKFFDVTSKLGRPENLPNSFSQYTEDSEVAVRTNLMTIEMPMLHSLDILMLLHDFYDNESNRFIPVRCRMAKIGTLREDAETLLNSSEKLQGECDLVWLTVFDPLQGKVTGAGEVAETEES